MSIFLTPSKSFPMQHPRHYINLFARILEEIDYVKCMGVDEFGIVVTIPLKISESFWS